MSQAPFSLPLLAGGLLVTHHLKPHPASRNDSLGGLLRPIPSPPYTTQRVVLTRWGVFLAPPPRYPVPSPSYTTQRVVLTRWGVFLAPPPRYPIPSPPYTTLVLRPTTSLRPQRVVLTRWGGGFMALLTTYDNVYHSCN